MDCNMEVHHQSGQTSLSECQPESASLSEGVMCKVQGQRRWPQLNAVMQQLPISAIGLLKSMGAGPRRGIVRWQAAFRSCSEKHAQCGAASSSLNGVSSVLKTGRDVGDVMSALGSILGPAASCAVRNKPTIPASRLV